MIFRTHDSPAWRHKSDALVQALLEEENNSEQIWCRELGDDKFEVCCIPFYLYDVALGDIILAPNYHFQRVLEPSGHYVFRVLLEEKQYGWRESIMAELNKFEALFEWYSAGLMSIDAPNLKQADAIATWLMECQQRGLLHYETGRI